DVLDGEREIRQFVRDVAAALAGIDVHVLRAHLAANAAVDEQRLCPTLHEQRTRGQRDPVALVRRRALLPQRLRDNTEHRSAVQPEARVEQGREPPVPEINRTWWHGQRVVPPPHRGPASTPPARRAYSKDG